jgi:hypothetical protein
VVVIALASRPSLESDSQPGTLLVEARMRALETGKAVTVEMPLRGGSAFATLLPDGRVAADPALGLDPLTGRTAHGSP